MLFGFLISNLLVCFSRIAFNELFICIIFSFLFVFVLVFLFVPMVKSVMHRSVITSLWDYLIKNTTKTFLLSKLQFEN